MPTKQHRYNHRIMQPFKSVENPRSHQSNRIFTFYILPELLTQGGCFGRLLVEEEEGGRRRHYSVIDFPFGIPLKAKSGRTAKGGQTSMAIFGNQFNTLLSSCFVHVDLKNM